MQINGNYRTIPSDTQLIQTNKPDAMREMHGYTNAAFVERARFHGLTPETLDRVAQEFFLQHAPDELDLISDQPLHDRPCVTCDLNQVCLSAFDRKRGACFL